MKDVNLEVIMIKTQEAVDISLPTVRGGEIETIGLKSMLRYINSPFVMKAGFSCTTRYAAGATEGIPQGILTGMLQCISLLGEVYYRS